MTDPKNDIDSYYQMPLDAKNINDFQMKEQIPAQLFPMENMGEDLNDDNKSSDSSFITGIDIFLKKISLIFEKDSSESDEENYGE